MSIGRVLSNDNKFDREKRRSKRDVCRKSIFSFQYLSFVLRVKISNLTRSRLLGPTLSVGTELSKYAEILFFEQSKSHEAAWNRVTFISLVRATNQVSRIAISFANAQSRASWAHFHPVTFAFSVVLQSRIPRYRMRRAQYIFVQERLEGRVYSPTQHSNS